MWRTVEKWGEQLKSGITFNFFSRWFQRRPYDQFDSQEDIVTAPEDVPTDDEDDRILMNTDDSLVVSYERSHGSCSIEHTVRPGDIHSSDRTVHRKAWNDRESGDEDVEDSNSDTKPFVRNPHPPYQRTAERLTEDLHGYVTSVVGRQYSRLENEADDTDDNDIIKDEDQSDGRKCDGDQVFHSIKDVNPKWKDKKTKRKKKLAKKARRGIRKSWKWLRKGFSGYARGFNPPNFFIISAASASVHRKQYS